MKRALLAILLCFSVAVSADAGMTCTEMLFIVDWIDIDGWWFPIFDLYEVCTVTPDPPPPPPPPEPPPPTPPPPPEPPPPPPVPATVTIGGVDTTDPYNPVVMVDVTSSAFSDPVLNVQLLVNGVGVGYSVYRGDGRYQFNITSIGNFGDGTTQLTGRACSAAGGCGEGSASLTRSTPSPLVASNTISASWQEADPQGPITRRADYGHTLRQTYTGTSFSCSETGGNSHAQVRDSLVTISGYDPMPLWNAAVTTRGTINGAAYALSPSGNPIACTYPIQCSSQSGSSAGTFGYAPSVDEGITSFVIEGQSALITNSSLSISIP